MRFWPPFWDPKSVKFGSKIEKIDIKNIMFFPSVFSWFGVVVWWFFNGFFKSKFRGSLESDFVKKLTKHWPWRQNQGSAFEDFSKKSEKI